eukprot:ctg_2395.g575
MRTRQRSMGNSKRRHLSHRGTRHTPIGARVEAAMSTRVMSRQLPVAPPPPPRLQAGWRPERLPAPPPAAPCRWARRAATAARSAAPGSSERPCPAPARAPPENGATRRTAPPLTVSWTMPKTELKVEKAVWHSSRRRERERARARCRRVVVRSSRLPQRRDTPKWRQIAQVAPASRDGRKGAASFGACATARGGCMEAAGVGPGRSSPMRQSRGRRAVVAQREEKGLRQFAVRVCEKVEQKGETDYEGVATELVQELLDAQAGGERDRSSDDKNIRRRVYDALNVLCAIGVIRKERRRILWQGLPRPSQREMERLRAQLRQRSEQQRQKLEMLEDIKLQQDALRALLERNKREPAVRERGRRGHFPLQPSRELGDHHIAVAEQLHVKLDAGARHQFAVDQNLRHPRSYAGGDFGHRGHLQRGAKHQQQVGRLQIVVDLAEEGVGERFAEKDDVRLEHRLHLLNVRVFVVRLQPATPLTAGHLAGTNALADRVAEGAVPAAPHTGHRVEVAVAEHHPLHSGAPLQPVDVLRVAAQQLTASLQLGYKAVADRRAQRVVGRRQQFEGQLEERPRVQPKLVNIKQQLRIVQEWISLADALVDAALAAKVGYAHRRGHPGAAQYQYAAAALDEADHVLQRRGDRRARSPLVHVPFQQAVRGVRRPARAAAPRAGGDSAAESADAPTAERYRRQRQRRAGCRC